MGPLNELRLSRAFYRVNSWPIRTPLHHRHLVLAPRVLLFDKDESETVLPWRWNITTLRLLSQDPILFQVLLNRRSPSSALCRGIMWPPRPICVVQRVMGGFILDIVLCVVRGALGVSCLQDVMFFFCFFFPSASRRLRFVYLFSETERRVSGNEARQTLRRKKRTPSKKGALNIHLFAARVKSKTTKLCVFPDNGSVGPPPVQRAQASSKMHRFGLTLGRVGRNEKRQRRDPFPALTAASAHRSTAEPRWMLRSLFFLTSASVIKKKNGWKRKVFGPRQDISGQKSTSILQLSGVNSKFQSPVRIFKKKKKSD